MTNRQARPLAFTVCFCIVLAVVGVLPGIAFPQLSVDSEQLLRSHFEPDHHLRMQEVPGGLELCADVCDFFSWGKRKPTTELWDFVLLYEYQRGIGTLEDVAESYQREVKPMVAILVSRYEQYCPGRADGDAVLTCVLIQLAERNKIRIGLVEYEKEARCIAWADIKDPNRISDYRCTENKKTSAKKPMS
jgi:hypothetical protein